MKNTHNDSTLIFLHIPKTAGSTFHFLLNTRYAEKGIRNVFGSRYSAVSIAEFIKEPKNQKQSIELLKGHMPFGLHRYLPKPATYISMLRDPVNRVVSLYFYIKKNVHNPLHDAVEKGGMSLTDFVTSGVAIGANNGQCRFLNGDLDEYPFDSDHSELLQNAIRNIDDHFAWVGLTERFDESVLVLQRLMNWRKPPHYLRENVSKTRKPNSSFSESDLDVVRQMNSCDMKLYDEVSKRLDVSVGKIDNFELELSGFQSRNRRLASRWGWLPSSCRRFVV